MDVRYTMTSVGVFSGVEVFSDISNEAGVKSMFEVILFIPNGHWTIS